MERLLAAVAERLAPVSAVVCSAGASAGGTVLEQTLERWQRVLETNLTGVFLVCRAALRQLIETGGAIVTVSSLGGLRAAPASAAYASSKAGLVMLTQCIAIDHGPQGVRANCVCPGWIRTPMADAAMEGLGPSREEAYARVNSTNPLSGPRYTPGSAASTPRPRSSSREPDRVHRRRRRVSRSLHRRCACRERRALRGALADRRVAAGRGRARRRA